MRDVKEACQETSNEHKDMHATISKLGRAIDKVRTRRELPGMAAVGDDSVSSSLQNFSSDLSAMCVDEAFSGQPCHQLNLVICEHLFRQGKLEVGEALVQVCVCYNCTVCYKYMATCVGNVTRSIPISVSSLAAS